MPSARGVLVFAAGICLWLAARVAGSATLHMVAVGLVVLPFAAALLARGSRQRPIVRRRLSDAQVAPGSRVTVEMEVENASAAAAPYLLLEDRVPPALGRPARLVVAGVPPKGRQRAAYTLVAHTRGRYRLGPVSVDVADPFALTRLRLELDEHDELIVTPEVEDLSGGPTTPFGLASGLALARHLFRSGQDFYTMRPYQEGDDLRRIHWPSVARTGELMIRQDESTRRASAVLHLDTRDSAVGQIHSPQFEKAVSVAASIGVLLCRAGFSLRLSTALTAPARVTEEKLLGALAGVGHHPSRALTPSLTRLRGAAAADAVLVAVTAPLPPAELTALIRTGAAFGPKLAVLVHPADPESLPGDRGDHLEARASSALVSLSRSGWEVLVLSPTGRLREVWFAVRNRKLALSG